MVQILFLLRFLYGSTQLIFTLNFYGSIYSSLMILESPPCEFLLYSREMVEDLINKLDDKDLDCVLTLDKGKPAGKGGKPKAPKPKAPKTLEEIAQEKKKEDEEKNRILHVICILGMGGGMITNV